MPSLPGGHLQGVLRHPCAPGRQPDVGRGRVARPDRPERRRQDHADERHRGRCPAGQRRDASSTGRPTAADPAPASVSASRSSTRSSTSSPICRSRRTSSSTDFRIAGSARSPYRPGGHLVRTLAAGAGRPRPRARNAGRSAVAGERQLVEIAKALQLDARIIIFDEPTTSLTARETDRLFSLIERLREPACR